VRGGRGIGAGIVILAAFFVSPGAGALPDLPSVSVAVVQSGLFVSHGDTFEITQVQFELTRTGDVSQPLTVQLTYAGTAVLGDFAEPPPSSATFAAGSATSTVTVSPELTTPFPLSETVTTLTLVVAVGDGYLVGQPSAATATIEYRIGTPAVTIAPTTGPPGTTVQVSGTDCPDPAFDATLNWNVAVLVPTGPLITVGVTPPAGPPTTPIAFIPEDVAGSTVPAADGSWSTDIPMPPNGTAGVPGTTARLAVTALCYATEGAEAGIIHYQFQFFDLVTPAPPIIMGPNFTG
jgi:hypothetical protein